MTRAAARITLLAAVGLLALEAGFARSASGPAHKQQLAALPDEERVWVADYVAPIILPEEEKLFLALTQPHEWERFKREFWARREQESQPFPLGPGYEVRYAELRRLADEVYDGWHNDAGRMVLRHGEPASIEPVRGCEHVFRDLELWHYSQGTGGITLLLFYRFPENGPRRLWNLGVPDSEIFARDSCRQRRKDLVMDCTPALGDPCRGPVCGEACRVSKILLEISWRQGNGAGAEQEKGRLLAPPQIPLEGIDRVKDVSATAADPNAKPLSVTGPSGTVPPTPVAAPAPAVKKSKKEMLSDLPIEERSWLTEYVAPIIQPEEEQLFLELSRPEQFALFKAEFWNRREKDGLPFPMGPGYRGRYEELRRLADDTYDGWRNDAGLMVLRYGEPASINSLQGCTKTFRDLEIWTYRQSAQAQGTMHHFFYRTNPGAPRRLWTFGTSDSDVFQSGSCRKNFPSLSRDCTDQDPTDNCRRGDCSDLCGVYRIYEEIRSRQGSRTGGETERGKLLQSQKITTEELDSLRARMLGTLSAPAPPPPAVPPRPVKKKSRKELLANLPDEERDWVTSFVAPIILKPEEDLFLDLTEGYQREIFKRDFWARRELDSLGPPFGQGFQQRYEELRPRLDSVYDGWRNDAAQLVLHYGEPADIHHVEGCDMVFRDIEIWTYSNLGIARGNVHHLFYRPSPGTPRKLWRETETPMEKQLAQKGISLPGNQGGYDEIFSPQSCRRTLGSLFMDCQFYPNDPCKGPVCTEACDVYKVYQEELARQGNYLGGMVERARLFKLPDISTEGLEQLRTRFATTANPNAKQLSVQGPSSSTKPRATPEPTPTPEPLHALTPEEIRDRIVHLEPKYRQFLDLAGPLLTEDELQRFLQMTPKDKDRFVKAYWKRHS